MARITVEDSLKLAKNRFALVLLANQRTKQLLRGSKPLSDRKENREIVTALREIAAGNVTYVHPEYIARPGVDEMYSAGDEKLIDHQEEPE
ncbi:MAG: DNA-directed RNA polymerase subunit omega [Deltaproteobacteria bacterium]|nr:DNA-directed RNA polymerase subunit omega [Deltaproteobacteria bacterium]